MFFFHSLTILANSNLGFRKYLLVVGALFGLSMLSAPLNADLVVGWNLGEQAPDFNASYLNEGDPTATTWHGEYGADAYVVSTCAMWCAPCQQFAIQTGTMRQTLAAEGLDVQFYDFIFQNNAGNEPGEAEIQLWVDQLWTSEPENVWFGGMIPESVDGNVTHAIFDAVGETAIPAIVVMDRNFVVRHHQAGFSQSHIEQFARNAAAVPEPGTLAILAFAGLGLAICHRRRGSQEHSRSGNGLFRAAASQWQIPRKSNFQLAIFVCLFFVSASPAISQLAPDRTTLAETGGSTPSGDGTYADFFSTKLNDDGGVAFLSFLEGTSSGVFNNVGLFRIDNGSTTEIVREGDQVLGATFTIQSPNLPGLNDQGEVLFIAGLTDGNGDVFGGNVFIGDGSSIIRVRAIGDSAPGGNGSFSNGLGVTGFNNSRQFLMFSNLSGTLGGQNDDQGLFFYDGNQFQEVIRKGDAVVGGGGTIQGFNGGRMINSSGDVLFGVRYSGNLDQDSAIVMGSGGNLMQVVREGDSTPDGNGFFSGSFSFDFNDQKQTAFLSNYIDNSTGPSGGLFFSDGGVHQEIVTEGDAAPDGNGILSGTLGTLQLNNQGQVGFVGDFGLTAGGTTDRRAVLRASTSGLTQIARTGQTLNGSTITSLSISGQINDSGQMLFSGTLAPANNSGDHFALMTGDGIDLLKVVQVGDLHGNISTSVASIRSGFSLNRHGQILYTATLNNGNSVVDRWTPGLSYRVDQDGDWDDNHNWTLSLTPDHVHRVSIRGTDSTITGPSGTRSVRSLTLGDTNASSQSPLLQLQSNSVINAVEQFAVHDSGRLSGTGTVDSPVIFNRGLISGGLTLNGSVEVSANGLIQANPGDTLTINGDLESPNAVAIAGGAIVNINGRADFANPNISTGSGTLGLNGSFGDSADIVVQESVFGGNLSLGANANSVFQFQDQQNFDSWTIGGDLSLGGSLTVQAGSGFGFNQEFLIQDTVGTRTGQYAGLSQNGLVGNFGGQDLFISYTGGNGNDTVLFTEKVPQWIGGTGNWHDTNSWENGLPTTASKMVLLDNDPNVNSFVSTADQDITIQNLRIDAGDQLNVQLGTNNSSNSFRGNLRFDSASSDLSTLHNDGLVEVLGGAKIQSRVGELNISGSGTIRLNGNSLQSQIFAGGDLIVNGAEHAIEAGIGINRIQSRFRNEGIVDSNSAGGILSIEDFNSSVDDDVFINTGILRASNGGTVNFSQLELDGGIVEASGSGSRIRFFTRNFPLQGASTIRNATLRTDDPFSSAGGMIFEQESAPLFMEDVTNEGFFQGQHIALRSSLDNSGTIQTVNSGNDNISLVSDVVVTGNGILDFVQGGNAVIGDFAFENQSNRINGKGSFRSASVIMGVEAILDPSDGGSFRADIGVFEFEAPTLFDGTLLEFDLQGIQVGDSDPLLTEVNTWRDTFFSENGLNQVSIDYDQLNIFETLTLDGLVEIDVDLIGDFNPLEGQFFDVLTANELVLNGEFDFDLPIIDGLTLDHQILNLFDSTTGFNRDVLRLTFGATAVPEPSSLLLFAGCVLAIGLRRKRCLK